MSRDGEDADVLQHYKLVYTAFAKPGLFQFRLNVSNIVEEVGVRDIVYVDVVLGAQRS